MPGAAAPPPHGPVGLAALDRSWERQGERRKAHRNPRSRRRAYLVWAAVPQDPNRHHAGVAAPGSVRASVAVPGVAVLGHRAEGLPPPSIARWAWWSAGRSAVGRGGRAVGRSSGGREILGGRVEETHKCE